MTTQTAHGQLINELLTEVAALRADFAEYRSAFQPPLPFDPRRSPLSMRNKKGE